MKTILLLEDDSSLNRGISLQLKKEGYHVFSAYTVAEAQSIFQRESVQMVISDISLPDGSGLDFGEMVRRQSDVYLIYLTAMDSDMDIVSGYDTGADDYVTKPFSLMALTYKVHALMRRLDGTGTETMISGDIVVSLRQMQASKAGQQAPLSRTELQLLIYLMENAGRIVTRDSILENVWGLDGSFVDDNTVTVNISRLKRKLDTESIENVRGLGYIWTGQVVSH